MEGADTRSGDVEGAPEHEHPLAGGPYPKPVTGAVDAAFESAGEHPMLLLYTISSVQEFVSAARRTQDLWAGSYIYSWFMWQAISAAYDQQPESLLIPHLEPSLLGEKKGSTSGSHPEEMPNPMPSVAGFPNMFSAVLSSTAVESVTNKARERLEDARGQMFEKVKKAIEVPLELANDEVWNERWETQKTRFLLPHVNWVAVPVEREKYLEASARAAQLLAARKGLRLFAQLGEEGHRCTLCGINASLQNVPQDLWEELRGFNGEPKLAGRLRRGEALCAVCLTRRLALQIVFTDHDYHMFSSTASVAASDWLHRLANTGDNREGAGQFAELATETLGDAAFPARPLPAFSRSDLPDKLKKLDGGWLYMDAWEPGPFGRETGKDVDTKRLNEVKESLAGLHKSIGRPCPYFALVAFDGDELGKWISGQKDVTVKPEMHATLGLALRNFSTYSVPEIVEGDDNRPGTLVYAGGDDVLAMFPLRTVLASARLVHDGFNAGKRDDRLLMPSTADLSAAAVICHYSHPLSHAVEEALHHLKASAKGTYGRGAIAIRLLKRSGRHMTTGLKWRSSDGTDLVETLDDVANAISNGHLSPSLAADLRVRLPLTRGFDRPLETRYLKFALSRFPRESATASDLVASLLKELQKDRNDKHPLAHLSDLVELAAFLARWRGTGRASAPEDALERGSNVAVP